MTPQQRKLVEDHIGYADYVVSKLVADRRCFEPATDDMKAAAMLGMCEAAQRFDPAKGLFTTYAWYWMRMRALEAACSVLNPVDHWDRQGRKAVIGSEREDETPVVLEDWLPPTYQPVLPGAEGLDRLFEHLREHYSERDVTIYRMVVIGEKPMRVAGAAYGISRARVKQILDCISESAKRFSLMVRGEAA